MLSAKLKVALVGGPSYDPLYHSFQQFKQQTGIDVEIGFIGHHPELNEHLDRVYREGTGNYDLVSTHTKYAPSQSFLMPLDNLVSSHHLLGFTKTVLDLARIDKKLMSVPRNVDVRLLFYRKDWLDAMGLKVPQTWEELYQVSIALKQGGKVGFAYTGKESGLFGTFFELLVSSGGSLFDAKMQPAFDNEAGRYALQMLRRLYVEGLTPQGLPDMHYDEVSNYFRGGHCGLITDWPGYFSLYENPTEEIYGKFGVALLPGGITGKRAVYGGSHSFAIPSSAQDPTVSARLLEFLTALEVQTIDAENGHIPVHRELLQKQKSKCQIGSIQEQRWEMLDYTLQQYVIIPPKFPEYPQTEDLLWMRLQDGITGKLSVDDSVNAAAKSIRAIVTKYA